MSTLNNLYNSKLMLQGKVPDAASVIWFSWWRTSRSETCREKL